MLIIIHTILSLNIVAHFQIIFESPNKNHPQNHNAKKLSMLLHIQIQQ